MKKFLLIAVAAMALATASQAQDSTANRKMKMEHGDKMNRPDMMNELNLTQDQKDKIKKFRDENMTKMEALKNNTSLNDDQKQEQMKSLRVEQRKNMEAVLTDEQKAKMKQLREEHMKERQGMKAGSDSTMRR